MSMLIFETSTSWNLFKYLVEMFSERNMTRSSFDPRSVLNLWLDNQEDNISMTWIWSKQPDYSYPTLILILPQCSGAPPQILSLVSFYIWGKQSFSIEGMKDLSKEPWAQHFLKIGKLLLSPNMHFLYLANSDAWSGFLTHINIRFEAILRYWENINKITLNISPNSKVHLKKARC